MSLIAQKQSYCEGNEAVLSEPETRKPVSAHQHLVPVEHCELSDAQGLVSGRWQSWEGRNLPGITPINLYTCFQRELFFSCR